MKKAIVAALVLLAATACKTVAPPSALTPPSVAAPPFLRSFAVENERRPTVLIVPGCEAPLISSRAALFERHARRLSDEGFAAAIVSYPGADLGEPGCVSVASAETISRAINRALTELAHDPRFDPSRIHLVGWSQGATGVLAVMQQAKRQPGLVSAAVFYPPCPKPEIWQSAVTLFMLLGEKDVVTPPGGCRIWADKSEGPGPVVINRYVGVGHGFDVGEAADPAFAAFLREDVPMVFDASTAHQAMKDLLSFLRLDLPAA
jgi:dienelactone hydrolase